MNRAKLLNVFASEMKEINNIDRPDEPAWRQTRNSLGIIATELPPSVCLGCCCWTSRALMRGLTGCPDVDAARHYGWLKAKWGSILPLLPLAGGNTTAGIKAKWGSMQPFLPLAGGDNTAGIKAKWG